MAAIRPATAADAEAIARVHVDSWRASYKDFLPADFLANLSIERRAEQWRNALTVKAAANFIFVAEDTKTDVVGFVASGPERESKLGYSGEIYAIYLLQTNQGAGLGRELFQTAVSDLKQRGFLSLHLWVLAENPSRGFYERMGGLAVAEKKIEIGGVELNEVAYAWNEI